MKKTYSSFYFWSSIVFAFLFILALIAIIVVTYIWQTQYIHKDLCIQDCEKACPVDCATSCPINCNQAKIKCKASIASDTEYLKQIGVCNNKELMTSCAGNIWDNPEIVAQCRERACNDPTMFEGCKDRICNDKEFLKSCFEKNKDELCQLYCRNPKPIDPSTPSAFRIETRNGMFLQVKPSGAICVGRNGCPLVLSYTNGYLHRTDNPQRVVAAISKTHIVMRERKDENNELWDFDGIYFYNRGYASEELAMLVIHANEVSLMNVPECNYGQWNCENAEYFIRNYSDNLNNYNKNVL